MLSLPKMIKAFISFLLVVLLVLAFVLLDINRLTDAKYLVEQSRKINLYGRLMENTQLLSGSVAKQPLAAIDTAEVFKSAVPAVKFYEFLEGYLASYLNWFTGRSVNPSYSYSLQDVKQEASSKVTERLLTQYNDLSICKADQIKAWNFTNGLPSCRLDGSSAADKDIARLANELTAASLKNIPDSITIPPPSASLLVTRNITVKIIQGFWLVWALTASLIALMILFLRRRAFFPLAIIFLLAGVTTVVVNNFGWDWVNQAAKDYITGQTEMKDIAPLLTDATASLTAGLKTYLGNLGLMSVILGVLLVVLRFTFRRARPKITGSVNLN